MSPSSRHCDVACHFLTLGKPGLYDRICLYSLQTVVGVLVVLQIDLVNVLHASHMLGKDGTILGQSVFIVVYDDAG